MTIICEVSLTNISSNSNHTLRASKATITFENKVGGIHLVVTKLGSDGGAGAKFDFPLVENVEKIFSKFLKEGKATIRFLQPPRDVSLKGKIEDVTKIVSAVTKLAKLKGERSVLIDIPKPAEETAPPPPKKKKIEIEKTKLEFTNHKEFVNEGHLPLSLKVLKVSSASISRLDFRCLRLVNLNHLQVNKTILEILPESMAIFPCLSILDLSSNKLTSLPRKFFRTLSPKLIHLNLASNELTSIHEDIGCLRNLEHLDLRQNNLERVPWKIGLLTKLRTLLLCKNRICHLPYTLTTRCMSKLGISDNPLNSVDTLPTSSPPEVKTLFELSAISVLNASVPYQNNVVPATVAERLEYNFMCYCGRRQLTAVTSGIISVATRYLSTEFEGQSAVPVFLTTCSNKCFKRVRSSTGGF